jgi:hypothetical protein
MKLEDLDDHQIREILVSFGFPQRRISVLCKDQLTQTAPADEIYVINMQSHDQGDRMGTHWVCLFKAALHFIYFDSFGEPPPIDVVNWIQRHRMRLRTYYSNIQLQQDTASSCGWWCIMVIREMLLEGKTFEDVIFKFAGRGLNGPAQSEKKLSRYFGNLLK